MALRRKRKITTVLTRKKETGTQVAEAVAQPSVPFPNVGVSFREAAKALSNFGFVMSNALPSAQVLDDHIYSDYIKRLLRQAAINEMCEHDYTLDFDTMVVSCWKCGRASDETP